MFPTAKVSVRSVGARYVLTAKDWGEANTPREMYDVIPTYPSSDGKGRQGWVYVVSRSIDDAEGELSVVPDPRNQSMVQERQDGVSIDGK